LGLHNKTLSQHKQKQKWEQQQQKKLV
jgi:hypothetical protein